MRRVQVLRLQPLLLTVLCVLIDMLFYTGKGDKGTSRVGRKKYPKDSIILETLGELDELNSLIGLAKSALKPFDSPSTRYARSESLRASKTGLAEKLENVQENLFIIQARIAWIMYPAFNAPALTPEKVHAMEREIVSIETALKPERGFVIAGENTAAGWLDYLRAVSRRTERKVCSLHKKHPLPEEILAYLNRLSSYLYALARESVPKDRKEAKPKYR